MSPRTYTASCRVLRFVVALDSVWTRLNSCRDGLTADLKSFRLRQKPCARLSDFFVTRFLICKKLGYRETSRETWLDSRALVKETKCSYSVQLCCEMILGRRWSQVVTWRHLPASYIIVTHRAADRCLLPRVYISRPASHWVMTARRIWL